MADVTDYDAAPATPAEYVATVETASQNVVSQGFEAQEVDTVAAEAAAAKNVVGAWAINYAAALDNYASRDDIEPLSQRRARESAATPADQDFARKDDYDGGFSAAPGDDNPYA
jgi:hypothetical protein